MTNWKVWIEPEWNWNRPRLLQRDVVAAVWIEPEWNWNFFSCPRTRRITQVWIEPEWNWNDGNHVTSCLFGWFESNQSGIETLSIFVESFQNVIVWIEPEWNWNLFSDVASKLDVVGLNRTRVELKLGFSALLSVKLFSLNRTRVELKHFYIDIQTGMMSQFESNQSGIETVWL